MSTVGTQQRARPRWFTLELDAVGWSDGRQRGTGVDGFGRFLPSARLADPVGEPWPWPRLCGSGVADHLVCLGQAVPAPALPSGPGELELVGWSSGGSPRDELTCVSDDGTIAVVGFGLTDFLSSRPAHDNVARVRCEGMWEQDAERREATPTVWTCRRPVPFAPTTVHLPFAPMIALSAIGWRPAP